MMEIPSSAPRLPKIRDTGLTVLHDPQGATADIVFIHGLQGHPQRTWTSEKNSHAAAQESTDTGGRHKGIRQYGKVFSRMRSGSLSRDVSRNDTYWPFDFLSKDCPNVRILTFGYDSKVSKFFSGSANQSKITDHASNLLQALRNERVNCQGRPLIIMAHSLGGIIVKDTICRAADGTTPLLDIFTSTRAIFFFGTPHRGSKKASLAELARRVASMSGFDSSYQNIHALDIDSSELERVNRAFMSIYERKHFQVVTFQETKGMVGINLFRLNEKVVDAFSSQLTGTETIISINANHRDMCRFVNKDDEGYQQVLGQLQHLLSGILNAPSEPKTGASVVNPGADDSSQISLSSAFSFDDAERKSIAVLTQNTANAAEYRASLPARVEGTCQWILSHPLCRDWIQDSTTRLLWISGYPGSGKTILSTYLLDYLSDGESSPTARKKGKLPCYFFCDEKIDSQRDGTAILRSLIHQLLLRRRLMIKHIKKAYEIQGPGFDRTFEALWRLFVDMASDKKIGPVNVIVDAIDECEELTRERFLQKVSNLVGKVQSEDKLTPPCIKFVITSRPLFGHPYTTNLLQINPSERSVDEDLRLVIHYKVDGIVQKTKCKRETGEYLKTALCSKADRTFLWVSLVLHLLEKRFLATQKDFQRIIDELPQTLATTYERFLQDIPEDHQLLASKLLTIIVGSTRSLSLDEMRILIAIEKDHKTVAAVEEDCQPNVRETIEAVLGPLVRIWDSKIYLVHQSLKEYLLNLSNQPRDPFSAIFGADSTRASSLMATKCLYYLSLLDFGKDLFSDDQSSTEQSPISSEADLESESEFWNPFELEDVALLKDPAFYEAEKITTIKEQYKLFDYASSHWAGHFAECDLISSQELANRALVLSDTTSLPASNWFRYYWPLSGVDLHRPQDFVSLVTACFLGHLQTVNRLGNIHEPSFAERGMYWAARMGHEIIFRQLLAEGVNPDFEVMSGETAIIAATQFNHNDVVTLLLEGSGYIVEKNVNRVNYAGLRGRTPLSVAAGNGFKEIVRLFLDHEHIQPDLPDYDQWTPLFWSVGGKHLDILQMLLTDPRVDVNHVDRSGRNVLSWAVSSDALELVKYLVSLEQLSADHRDSQGRTALSWAAGSGDLEATKYLRRSGLFDITGRDSNGRNALSWACAGMHYKVVDYLLKHDPRGADMEDNDGWTPLSWALFKEAPKTVKVLLSSGLVDVNKRDLYGISPLRFAVGYGYVDVVKLMLAVPGVDVKSSDNQGETPLSRAKLSKNEHLIELIEQAIN